MTEINSFESVLSNWKNLQLILLALEYPNWKQKTAKICRKFGQRLPI